MNEQEYILLVTNQYLQDWLDYNDDIIELERATRMENKTCAKIVSIHHPQFIVN